MTRNRIIIAFLPSGEDAAGRCRQELAEGGTAGSCTAANARGAASPTLELCCSDDLTPHLLEGATAVIVLAEGLEGDVTRRSFLTLLERSKKPLLAIYEHPPAKNDPLLFAGALPLPADAPADSIWSALRGVLHQQHEIDRLRTEMAVNERCQGGLQTEIAKFHEELQLAAMVQREFLPRELPSLHGVELAALWRPTNYVSGDIYDVIKLDEDHLGVFVADAVGHGVPAALLTMVITRSLVTREFHGSSWHILPPSDVLRRLNDEMIRRKGRSTRFATAVYAVINCRERTAVLAGAGHPPPLFIAADGESRMIDTPGGLLGVFEDEEYGQVEFDFGAGDQLLLYSDGFEQAFPPQDEESEKRPLSERYLSVFRELARIQHPLQKIAALARRLDTQRGSLHQIDDLTLICVTAEPLGDADVDARSPEYVSVQDALVRRR